MLRVTIESISARTGERKHLGTAEIANDGSGTPDSGNYVACLSKWGRPKQVWKRGKVKSFPRRARGPWDLLYLVLRDAVGSRNVAPKEDDHPR